MSATTSHSAALLDACERRRLASDVVLGLELTRATSLSYDEPTRESFRAELADLLERFPEVGLEQQTSLTLAQALR